MSKLIYHSLTPMCLFFISINIFSMDGKAAFKDVLKEGEWEKNESFVEAFTSF